MHNMDNCSNYIGLEKIDEERTRIKCRIMDGGGKVYANNDPESAEVIKCCWHGGEGCPFLLDEPEGAEVTNDEPERCENAAGADPAETVQAVMDGCGDIAVSANTVDGEVSGERQEKALRLHRQIVANGNIAASCMVEMGRDLKTVRDEKLYSEFGCADFAEYCEKKAGIGKRHGYNFIAVFERFGEDKLGQLQGLGIAKLLELAKLDDNDLGELMSGAEVSEMSVRELKDKIAEYDKTCEQLKLDLDSAESDRREADDQKARAEDEKNELKYQLEQAEKRRKELEEQVAKLEESESKSRESLANAIDRHLAEKQKLQEEARKTDKQYRDKIKELESRPAGEVSEEQIAAIRAEAEKAAAEKAEKEREEAVKAAREEQDKMWQTNVDVARKTVELKYSQEIKELKAQNEALRAGVDEAVKEAQNKINKAWDSEKKAYVKVQEDYQAKLKSAEAKIVELQSSAKNAAPAGDERTKVKFYLGQIQAAFISAVEVADGAPDGERQALRAALTTALERMREVVGNG